MEDNRKQKLESYLNVVNMRFNDLFRSINAYPKSSNGHWKDTVSAHDINDIISQIEKQESLFRAQVIEAIWRQEKNDLK
jgi:hypothetical protein